MDWTIAELVRRGASAHPSRTALAYDGRTLTYAELDARSSRVAAGLAGLGVEAGDRVAILDRNGPEQLEVMFGAAKLGAVIVPVNWRLSASEIAFVLSDCGARVLFAGAEFEAPLAGVRAQIPSLEHVLSIGEPVAAAGITSERAPAWPAAGDDYARWRDGQPAHDPHTAVAPGDLALLLYTSGTTGQPKGVMLGNGNLFTLLDRIGPMWGLGAATRSVVCMPLFHIGGIGWALAAMRFGGMMLLVRAFAPEGVLDLIERERATHVNLVPAMIAAMVDSPSAGRRDCSSLRMILYGTAPISAGLLGAAMRTFGCAFVQVYGLTETTSAITQLDDADHRRTDRDDAILRSAGRPYPWVQARVVDPVSLRECGPGETGELWTRSAQNMRGYWGDDDATRATMNAEGWLRTGDAGLFDAAGYLYLTDRVKDMIVSGGENVYPAEAERVLADHPAVAEVAVVGVPHPVLGETPRAVVVLARGAVASESELIGYARDRLAHYKCPTSVAFAFELPRNATGKVLKRVLREPYWLGNERRIH